MEREPHLKRATLAKTPIRLLTTPLRRLLFVEAADGAVLPFRHHRPSIDHSRYREAYLGFWQTQLGIEWGGFQMRSSIQLWINDGLMAIFFL